MSVTLAASTPARADRAIVFACDGRYLPYAIFAADRLARLPAARPFDICLCALGEDLVVPESLAGLGLRTCRIETDALAGLTADARRTPADYLRLVLPEALGQDYDRILYLDADVFPQGGDWSALLDVDLRGRAIGAVRDNIQWRRPRRQAEAFRILKLPVAPYLNSGLLLIDCAAFARQRILARCLELARARPGLLPLIDQGLLNGVLHGDWAELSPLWNWQYTKSSMLFEAMETAHAVHFIGARKPWTENDGTLPARFRRAYADFFARHLPAAVPEGAPVPAHANRRYLRRMLFRHLRVVARSGDYLDRFPTDLTILGDPSVPVGSRQGQGPA